MSLTYAGVPLLLDDRDGAVQEWLDRYLCTADLTAIGATSPAREAGGVYDALPRPNWTDPPPPRLNTLWWPTGASRWARFYGLVDTAGKDAILEATNDGKDVGLLHMEATAPTAEPIEGGGSAWGFGGAIDAPMWLLPPRPLTAQTRPDNDAFVQHLWLVPLVDARWFWQWSSVDPTADTWDDLATAIQDALFYCGDFVFSNEVQYLGFPDAFPFEVDTPDTDRVNAAVLLDAMLHSLGYSLSFCWNDDGDEVAVKGTFSEAPDELKWRDNQPDELPDDDTSANVNENPQEIVVQTGFEGYLIDEAGPPIAGGLIQNTLFNAPYSVTFELPVVSGGTLQDETETRTFLGSATGLFSGVSTNDRFVKLFRCNYPVRYAEDSAGAPQSNSDDVDEFVEERARMYYRSLMRRYDVTYPGIHWLPADYYLDFVEYVYRGGTCGASQTRVASLPHNFGTETLWVTDSDGLPLPESAGSGGGTILCKTAAAISKGASGTVNVHSNFGTKGSEAATGGHLTSVYNRYGDIASDKWCLVEYRGTGYELVMGEC